MQECLPVAALHLLFLLRHFIFLIKNVTGEMRKILLSTLAFCLLQTLHAQTKSFELYAVAEGNFGTPNGDVFRVTKGADTTITTSLPLYQTANNTGGFDVIQDFEIAGNKAVFGTKAGSSRIVVANFPSFDSVHTFSGITGGTQCMGRVSPTKVYLSAATGSVLRQLDLVTNTLTQVADPSSSIGSFASHMTGGNGFMYVAMASKIVKIDTVTNTAIGVIQPGLGSIQGLQYDSAGKHMWILGKSGGVSAVIKMEVQNNDLLSTPIIFTGLTNASMLRYYNNKLYLLAGKTVHIYDILNPNIPTSPVYTSTLGGTAAGFAYGKSFDVDPHTGDFAIGHANGYAGSSLFEVVDGTTFTRIATGSINGCRIVNELVLKTAILPAGLPVPTIDPLPVVKAQCAVSLTAPTAMSGTTLISGTTTDSLNYTKQGSYSVTWTYTNANGSVTQVQQVIVADTIAPVPDSAALPVLNVNCPYTVTRIPTATDNCLGTVAATTTSPLTYTTAGTYTITWTYTDSNANSAIQRQTIQVACNTSGIAGTERGRLTYRVTPNPANAQLNFELEANNSNLPGTVSLRDMMGREVLRTAVSGSRFSVAVAHLPAGVYFTTVQQAGVDRVATQQIVISH